MVMIGRIVDRMDPISYSHTYKNEKKIMTNTFDIIFIFNKSSTRFSSSIAENDYYYVTECHTYFFILFLF